MHSAADRPQRPPGRWPTPLPGRASCQALGVRRAAEAHTTGSRGRRRTIDLTGFRCRAVQVSRAPAHLPVPYQVVDERRAIEAMCLLPAIRRHVLAEKVDGLG